MKFLLQASALLLAIAVFPLPIKTGIANSPAIRTQAGVDVPSPPHDRAAVKNSAFDTFSPTASAILSTAVQPLPELHPDSEDVTIVLHDARLEATAETPAQAPTQRPPLNRAVKPQAVISTDFERNGLSEASFRTVARVAKAEQPPEEKVLVIGDSLSIPLGKRLEDYFSKIPGIHFRRLGKVSSGLARPDFFDWEQTLAKLATKMKPSTVVIMIGTNDNQTLKRADGSAVQFGGPTWDKEYTRRINRVFTICRDNNPEVKIFWVGAPIMGRPDLTRDVKRINNVIKTLCENNENCHYVDTWSTLADEEGRFTDFMTDKSGERVRIRATDGVHLSLFGAKILATRCLQAMTPNVAVMRMVAVSGPSG